MERDGHKQMDGCRCQGAYKADGTRETPSVVRFGAEEAMATTSRPFSINAAARKLFSPADAGRQGVHALAQWSGPAYLP